MGQRIAGLDLSLAGTAAVILDDDGRPSACLAYSSVKRDQKAEQGPVPVELLPARTVSRGDSVLDYRRTAGVADAVKNFLRKRLCTSALVGIEDHAFGAKGAHIYQLGHLHGMVRHDTVQGGFRFVLFNVKEVKRAATGNGAAEKAAMVDAAAHALSTSHLSRGVQEGLADAYAIARLAWFFDRLKRGVVTPSSLPGDIARMMVDTKKKPGLLSRAVVG